MDFEINMNNLKLAEKLKKMIDLEKLKNILSVCLRDESGDYLIDILRITYFVEDKDKNINLFIGVTKFEEAITIGYAC
jgi:NACalpha-BTF3-like transcription factor